MQRRRLGPYEVYPIGLGAMPLSQGGNVRPSEEQAIATIHAALDAGVTYIDTADIYAPSFDTMGHNERLVAKALKAYGGSLDGVVVGTKGGITRPADGEWGRNGTLDYLRSAVESSLRALDVDVIDLYQWHRPDRSIDFAEGVANFETLHDEGKVKAIGLSNVNIEEIDIAVEVLGAGGLASVQNEFSPRFRSSRDELDHCGRLGIAFLPWSPLGGTGSGSKTVGETYPALQQIAGKDDVSPQQVVLAWELSLGSHVIPIPGASRPASITDSARAADLQLSADDLSRLAGWLRP
jgi:aryl-alcohol dehydrogenase-like predicted oxidoreductase